MFGWEIESFGMRVRCSIAYLLYLEYLPGLRKERKPIAAR